MLLRAAACLLLLSVLPAEAHQIWLEQSGGKARLFFGEFNENLREASPGSLDKLQPMARLVSAAGEAPVELTKGKNAFALKAAAKAGDSLIAEDTRYPAFDRKQGEKTARTVWIPAARHVGDFASREPKLTLDVVPAGKPGAFKVFYQGKPLPKAKVEVIAASGWTQSLRTDDDGAASLALPWKGRYVVEVRHSDPTPGTRGAEAYDVVNYVTTLSFARGQGMAGPPPPPPAPPKP
jgi:uncharacterized GH25 family protein